MNKKALTLAVGFTIALSGCASIVSGSKQKITIDSYPQGAEVLIAGRSSGVTPLTIDVSRTPEEVKDITVKKEGYKPAQVKLTSKLNPWFWGNIVIGGVFGSSTDSSTGAKNDYEPGQYMVNLESEK
ncbi:MAG TPA: PEGA domain-containing protein [Pseudomonadales bacterium]|nr:PEGA domain-containing protein [Pseudomonadales bacterium]